MTVVKSHNQIYKPGFNLGALETSTMELFQVGNTQYWDLTS